MDHENVQSSKDMSLVLSTDAKPRLKWTPELHQRFVDAVNQLGGPEKATPKSLMRMLGIPGLTLYHLKSHLQKFRLGKNQQSEICKDLKQETVDSEENCSINELNLLDEKNEADEVTEDQIQEDVHIAEALQIQMEVQRKLHQQIEVQRRLQLRIEAQGKYLQKVLKKAHETLSGYNNCSSIGVEHAKAELSQLASMVSSSSFSELTETTDLSLDKNNNNNRSQMGTIRRTTGCSLESSLTSLESSERLDDETGPIGPSGPSLRKRSRSISCEGICVQEKHSKKMKFEVLETFDLNKSQCEFDLELSLKQPNN
ncbi:myb family transcription factor PHL8-like [Silene latifolia]|uniref:myb family transcription factor PHL8-like n=1 Tax=Silene latifolia TaxID=37657 RepID=UPI003D76A80C